MGVTGLMPSRPIAVAGLVVVVSVLTSMVVVRLAGPTFTAEKPLATGLHLPVRQQQLPVTARPCDYGLLAGYWRWSMQRGVGSKWQTVYPPCQLQDKLLPATDSTVSVLLLGDSVDLALAQEYCGALNETLAPPTEKHVGSNMSVIYSCSSKPNPAAATGQLNLAVQHILGVHPTGPYHPANETGGYKVRIPAALTQFKAKFDRPPDMVLVSSNLWDQARMSAQREHLHGVVNKLLPEVVSSWAANFSNLLDLTAATFPQGTLLLYHTTALPAPAATWLGSPYYVHQLNEAGARMAKKKHVGVIDLAAMVAGLPHWQYLQDSHHPRSEILLEMMNIAMNLLDQLRQQKQQQQQRKWAHQQAQSDNSSRSSSRHSSSNGSPVSGATAITVQRLTVPAGAAAASSRATWSHPPPQAAPGTPAATQHTLQQQQQHLASAASAAAKALQLPAADASDQQLWQHLAKEQEQQELEMLVEQLEWCATQEAPHPLLYMARQSALQRFYTVGATGGAVGKAGAGNITVPATATPPDTQHPQSAQQQQQHQEKPMQQRQRQAKPVQQRQRQKKPMQQQLQHGAAGWVRREALRQQQVLKQVLKRRQQQASKLVALQAQQAAQVGQHAAAWEQHLQELEARNKWVWGAGDKEFWDYIQAVEAQRRAGVKQDRVNQQQKQQPGGQHH